MNRTSIWLLVLVMVLAAGAYGLEVKPTGRLYANFQYDISGYPDWDSRSDDDDTGTFEIARAYLGVKARFASHWSAMIVSDVSRINETKVETIYDNQTGELIDVEVSEEKGYYGFYLKYGYGQYQPLDAFGMRLGSAPTPFIDRYEKAWGYRYVEKTPSDRVKWDSSADLGLVFLGNFPNGLGSYYAMVRNGEGYKNPDMDAGKAAHARILLKPFQMNKATKHLQLTAAYCYERELRENPKTTSHMLNTLLSYKYQINSGWGVNVGAGFDYLLTDDEDQEDVIGGVIYHGYAVVYFPYNLALFGRVDYFDPDMNNDKDTHGYQDESIFILGGISFDPVKNIAFAADVKQTRYTAKVTDDEGDEVTLHPDSTFYLHAKFKF